MIKAGQSWHFLSLLYIFPVRGERTLLVHGLESDWVEEEMMNDDVEFIRDVMEQKVHKAFLKAGIKKKVFLLINISYAF